MASFKERLNGAAAANRSLLCVGLDPDPGLMPVADVFEFNRRIIDATKDLVCAYKPNLAFYEALGLDGLTALYRTMEYIRRTAPAAVVIGDAKRGDIDSSSVAYAKAMFGYWGFDAVTVNPYLGRDSVEPFLAYADRGVFILCRTSNRGAGDFQDQTDQVGCLLYQTVAAQVNSWSMNAGLVVGATYPKEIGIVRRIAPEAPFLIPGVGKQAGDLSAAVKAGVDAGGRGAVINSSRGVIYAGGGLDFAQLARREAQRLRSEINQALTEAGHPWP